MADDFSKALDSPYGNVPVVQAIPVSEPATVVAKAVVSNKADPLLAGFELWIPPTPSEYADGMPLYEILGTDAQIVQFPLRPGRKVMCFSGAMAYMSDGVKMEAQFVSFGKTFGRIAGGGSLMQLTYTNESSQDGYIAMTPDYPGVIVPMDLRTCPSGKIIAMRDSFLCATVGLGDEMTDVGAGFNPAQSIGGFCCSGVDFIVQTIQKGDWAFLMAMGTVIQRNLQQGEKILVDTDSILCFEASVGIDIQWVGNIGTICCGGEGLFNTTMTGPGKIWIQSLSIDKMRKLFPPNVQTVGGGGGDGFGGDGFGDGGGDGGGD